MFRAIIIDSDRKALDSLERDIRKLSRIDIIGKYTSPHAGLIAVVQLKPDVIFLDVDFEGTPGLDIAHELMNAIPEIQIVLMASNEKYAVDAFELQVKDYILKPITEERLKKTINKLNEKKSVNMLSQWMIRCFKRLEFVELTDKTKLIDVKWRTAKSKEIFAYLLQHRHSEVRKDTLTKMFWPNSKEKEAYAQLYTAIYHIRKTINTTGFQIELINSNTGYELELDNVLIDVEEFRRGISENLVITDDNVDQHRKTLDIYRGDYLEVENYDWAKNKQSRLHFLYVNYSRKIADFYVEKEYYSEAIMMFTKLQNKLPYQEDYYFKLMKLFFEIGDIETVKTYYQKMMTVMKQVKRTPKEEIQLWYKSNIN